MQTKFKWNAEQRLMMIAGLATGIKLVPNIEIAQILGEDIYIFARGEADFINSDECIQFKLTKVFEMQQLLGTNNIYEKLLQLEQDNSRN